MASILKVDTIQDQAGNNIISEAANVITIGASGDTITVPAGATVSGFTSAGIDDNANATAITIDSSERVGLNTTTPGAKLEINSTGNYYNTANQHQQWSYSGTPFLSLYMDAYANPYFDTDSASGWNPSATMVFKRQGSEKFRITSDGKVGIGTSSPASELEIESATPEIRIDATSGAGRNYKVHSDGNELYIEGIGSSGSLKIGESGTYGVNIDLGSGTVGIGETSPLGLLHVKSADSGATVNSGHNQIIAENSGNSGMTILSGTSSNGAICFGDGDDNCIGFLNYTHNGNHLDFGVSGGEKMRILSDGRVGIGTTNPNRMLTVEGDGGEPDISLVNLDNTNNNFNQIRFLTVGSDDSVRRLGADIKALYTSHSTYNPTTDLVFGTASGSSASTESMRITSTGNVGIGTSSTTGDGLTIYGSTNNTILTLQNPNVTSGFRFSMGESGYSHKVLRLFDNDNRAVVNFDGEMGLTSFGSVQGEVDTGEKGVSIRGSVGQMRIGQDGTGTSTVMGFYNPNGEVGKIQTTGSSIAINSGSDLILQTANSERMRIDSSGKLLVNTTSNGTESNLNVSGQFGMSSGRGFIFERQEGRNGSSSSITLQFTTGANGRTCFIETMVGSSGYHLYHVSHRYRGNTPNVLVNQGNGPTISWSVSNSGSNTGSVYTYVVNFPSSTSHPYAKFKVSLGGYITTPITSPSITFA